MENELNSENSSSTEANSALPSNLSLQEVQDYIRKIKEVDGAKGHPGKYLRFLSKEMEGLSSALKKTWFHNPFIENSGEIWGADEALTNEIGNQIGKVFIGLLDIANMFGISIGTVIRNLEIHDNK